MKKIIETITVKINTFFEVGLEGSKKPDELSMSERAAYDEEINEALALAKNRH